MKIPSPSQYAELEDYWTAVEMYEALTGEPMPKTGTHSEAPVPAPTSPVQPQETPKWCPDCLKAPDKCMCSFGERYYS